jgi:aspartyl-tRNA(Asn)/glutamyl-tRNA(Gln) amidotransferase subunit B
MERGDMRLEPNISLRGPKAKSSKLKIDKLPPYKIEVKNINSFKFVAKAINFEISRQSEILDDGKIPQQETRGFFEKTNSTISQRIKEEASDYRYFPEPDIPPLRWTKDYINKLNQLMPELPKEKQQRFEKDYGLSSYDAEILTRERILSDFFEKSVESGKEFDIDTKKIANYLIHKKPNLENLLPAQLVKMIVKSTKVSDVNEEKLDSIIEKVLSENPKALEDFKKGKESVIMFLVGQVMRQFNERIDAEKVKIQLIKKLK